MYASGVACCPLVNHAEYAPRALLRLEKNETDGQTTDRYTTLAAQRGQRGKCMWTISIFYILFYYVFQ